jgi:hypothetical protein
MDIIFTIFIVVIFFSKNLRNEYYEGFLEGIKDFINFKK